jgi:hypothetical protein
MKQTISDKLSITISIIALLVTITSVYFQFFNINHSVLYCALEPEFNLEKKELKIPVLLKNLGNQTEVILSLYLYLETKEDTSSFFRRISEIKSVGFPITLAPSENKLINLSGDIKQYMFGTFEILDTNKIVYHPISHFDSLEFKMQISYLSNSGIVAKEERSIGYITFNKDESIKRMDCLPIKLKKLDVSNNENEIIKYSIIPQKYSQEITINLKDTNDLKKYKDRILLMRKLIGDSVFNNSIFN